MPTKKIKKTAQEKAEKAIIDRLGNLILARLQTSGTTVLAHLKESLRSNGAEEGPIGKAVVRLIEKKAIVYDTVNGTITRTHREDDHER